MSPSPNVPARSIRCGAISSSAGYASKRTAAPECTPRETVGGVDQCGWRTGADPNRPARRPPEADFAPPCDECTALTSARRQQCHSAAPCDRIRRDHASEAAMTPTPKVALITEVATLAYLGQGLHGWGSFAAFFSHPPLIALVIVGFVLAGVALFSGGNLSPGEREDKGNRWVLAAFGVIGILLAYLPALHGSKGLLDPGRGCRSLAWRRSLRRRRCAADLAGVRARPPVQRARRHPARAYAGHERGLRHHSSPQLSGLARWLLGMGARLSLGGRRAADGAHDPAARRAHPRGRAAAAHPVR